ncbi:hypothetical protein BKA70DRAFT_1276300 [Coprinopsis sp. MPI-PUGE-AT-0042]|nr:hypothetical protein BKA70DRAFT_1276300 [Coprinopsis sp. MPI-PUGE-AT-0042]
MFKLSNAVLVAATILAVIAPVRTAPTLLARQSTGSLVKENALQAQKLNAKFSTIKTTDSCQGSDQACVNGAFAQCVQGKWAVHAPCASNLRCYALPLVLKQGVALVCDTPDGADRRFQDAGVSGGPKGTGAAPIEDDEEIDDCEEEDELEGRMFAEDDEYHYFYKRQVATNEPVTLAEIPSSPQSTASSTPSSTVSAVVTSSPAAAATPTVVIGTDGIVTVTVVSTVFAAPTACANTGVASASALPTAVTVSRASPLSSVSARPSSVTSSAASVRPTAFSSSAPRPSSAIPLSAVTTASSSSPSPSAVNNGGGFSFTFARRSFPTPEA